MRRLALASAAALAALFAFGGYQLWYHHRGPPDPIAEHPLFRGITYERRVYAAPRPMVVHLARIDMDAPGLRPVVTSPDPSGGRQVRARRTSTFLGELGLQLAINGSFFYPFHSDGPFDYYPHEGDPVDVVGRCASDGVEYGDGDPASTTLELSAGQRISGAPLLVSEGEVLGGFSSLYYPESAEPRTAIALDRSGRRALLVVVDGRQPSYSEGMTLTELAELIVELGYQRALNLDGGGSSVMVVEEDGSPSVLSSPIHGRHPPGVERSVANHVGFFAEREDHSSSVRERR